MRKGTKSFYGVCEQLPEGVQLEDSKINVVVGVYILHKVEWNRNDYFGSICEKYVYNVRNHYGSHAVLFSMDIRMMVKKNENRRKTSPIEEAYVCRCSFRWNNASSNFTRMIISQTKFV